MNKYTLYCTEVQTKKAIGLGAPIEKAETRHDLYNNKYCFVDDIEPAIIIPTAEQMLGWLEKQYVYINICWDDSIYYVQIKSVDKGYLGIGNKIFQTRKEATLAAIDIALEYLVGNKFSK